MVNATREEKELAFLYHAKEREKRADAHAAYGPRQKNQQHYDDDDRDRQREERATQTTKT